MQNWLTGHLFRIVFCNERVNYVKLFGIEVMRILAKKFYPRLLELVLLKFLQKRSNTMMHILGLSQIVFAHVWNSWLFSCRMLAHAFFNYPLNSFWAQLFVYDKAKCAIDFLTFVWNGVDTAKCAFSFTLKPHLLFRHEGIFIEVVWQEQNKSASFV